jgi:hypothetical protein
MTIFDWVISQLVTSVPEVPGYSWKLRTLLALIVRVPGTRFFLIIIIIIIIIITTTTTTWRYSPT